MTTTSIGVNANSDTPMSEAQPPSSTSPSSTSNVSDVNESRSYAIKIEFKTNSSSFPAPEIHRKIILELERQYPSTTINTNTNPNIKIKASEQSNDYFLANFKYPSFSRSKFSLACVAHNVVSDASFSEIITSTKKVLTQHKAFLRINKWHTNELDIVNIGWIYGAHPQAHNRDNIIQTIKRYSEETNKLKVELEIFPKSISSTISPRKRITTQAIQFACPKEQANAMKTLLQECFSHPDLFLPGKFIPSDFAYKQGQTAFHQYIQHQNKYLVNHRSISLVGIHPSDLIQSVDHNGKPTSLIQILKQSSCVDWISSTNRTASTGRYLISTNKDSYQSTIKWIDDIFLPLFTIIPNKTTLHDFHDITPRRISFQTPQQDEYSKSLVSSLTEISATSFVRPPNAWNKPISIIASQTPQTSISKMTSSDTSTVVEQLEQKIESLTNIVASLQKKLESTQQLTNESLNKAVNNAFQVHHQKLEMQYQHLIASINNHWKQVTSSLPNSLNVNQPSTPTHLSPASSPHTTPSRTSPASSPHTTPPRTSDEKRLRDGLHSGSGRARKPRRYSSGALESVQRSITSFLSQPKDPDPDPYTNYARDNQMNDD